MSVGNRVLSDSAYLNYAKKYGSQRLLKNAATTLKMCFFSKTALDYAMLSFQQFTESVYSLRPPCIADILSSFFPSSFFL